MFSLATIKEKLPIINTYSEKYEAVKNIIGPIGGFGIASAIQGFAVFGIRTLWPTSRFMRILSLPGICITAAGATIIGDFVTRCAVDIIAANWNELVDEVQNKSEENIDSPFCCEECDTCKEESPKDNTEKITTIRANSAEYNIAGLRRSIDDYDKTFDHAFRFEREETAKEFMSKVAERCEVQKAIRMASIVDIYLSILRQNDEYKVDANFIFNVKDAIDAYPRFGFDSVYSTELVRVDQNHWEVRFPKARPVYPKKVISYENLEA